MRELEGIGNLPRVGGAICLDFANTVHNVEADDPLDEAQSFADLVTWGVCAGLVSEPEAARLRELTRSHPDRAVSALDEARGLRSAITSVFGAIAGDNLPAASDLETLQRAWVAALGHASIDFDEGARWRWPGDTGDPNALMWPVVESAIVLLQSEDRGRVRMCGGRDCSWLFVDGSKNRGRRWCQMEVCGNREKARRHYLRTKSRGEDRG